MPAASAVRRIPDYWPVMLMTSRLTLRPVASDDVPGLIRLWSDPEVRRYLGGPMPAQRRRALERTCVGAVGVLAVQRDEDAAFVGMVFVEPNMRGGHTEVSYEFLPEHWGNGYGREAVGATVAWALGEVHSDRPGVIAVTQQANLPSRRLLEALGMVHADSFIEGDAEQVLYATAGPHRPASAA